MPSRPKIIIVGAGFAGLNATKRLAKAAVDIMLIDQRNHHLFQPLLYQVATAELSGDDIASPIRHIVSKQSNVTVHHLDQVTAIDGAKKTIDTLGQGLLSYDFLIMASGATPSYFGHNHWAKHAASLKNLTDALTIRRQILLAFEQAENSRDRELQSQYLTFVVIGGGPTGVELAGAIGEITQVLSTNFRHFKPKDTSILLVEAGERILSTFKPKQSQQAERQLQRFNVVTLTHAPVKEVKDCKVVLPDRIIKAKTILWAAGVQGTDLLNSLGVDQNTHQQVLVSADLTVPQWPSMYVVGDAAALQQANGQWVPGVAPAAIQQGRHAANNIMATLNQQPRQPFRYKDRGAMVTIGRRCAIATIGRWHFSGFMAWWAWLVVHIAWLIGFRNRLVVLVDWFYANLFRQRGARIILEPAQTETAIKPIKTAPVNLAKTNERKA